MADETVGHTAGPAAAPQPTAGALIRRAREAQGLHIAVLAASLKVPQRKLEALERDRLDELPDATFTRALAQTVCRALKIDAAPVLALLPRAGAEALDQVSAGLNAPFRERSTAADLAPVALLRHPATLIVLVLLLAAAAIWLWPVFAPRPAPAIAPVAASAPAAALPASESASEPASAVIAEAAASGPLVETVHSAPPIGAADGVASAPSAAPANLLSLRASQESWIEVTDGKGTTLLSRTVQSGERVGLDGTLPLRVIVGNAAGTELLFRGQAVDLLATTRDNVARVELK